MLQDELVMLNHDQRQGSTIHVSHHLVHQVLGSSSGPQSPRHATLLTCSILYHHVDFLLSSSLWKYVLWRAPASSRAARRSSCMSPVGCGGAGTPGHPRRWSGSSVRSSSAACWRAGRRAFCRDVRGGWIKQGLGLTQEEPWL